DLLAHILERLRGANDRSHSARRRAFFDRIGFTPGPAERNALKLRHPAAHRGYLWRTRDGLDQLDELTRQTKIARSFVNNVILSLLGYRGVVLDYVLDANVSPTTLRQR
ncbi:MAG TPA: hypothetical protein VKX96_16510, partial [Chloroflexota bacterium]|nr:hypothetical protein [Chloroflexota bacterium]